MSFYLKKIHPKINCYMNIHSLEYDKADLCLKKGGDARAERKEKMNRTN
jgi:hypothetical protein